MYIYSGVLCSLFQNLKFSIFITKLLDFINKGLINKLYEYHNWLAVPNNPVYEII